MAGHSGFFYNRVCKEKCLADREKGGRSVEKLLEIQHLMKYYGNKSSLTKAVNDISFSVEKVNLQRSWEPAVRERPPF